MFDSPDFTWTLKLLQGSEQLLLELNRFYAFQKMHGEHIRSLGAKPLANEADQWDFTLRNLIGKLHKVVSWHFGLMAYKLMKKEPTKSPPMVD